MQTDRVKFAPTRLAMGASEQTRNSEVSSSPRPLVSRGGDKRVFDVWRYFAKGPLGRLSTVWQNARCGRRVSGGLLPARQQDDLSAIVRHAIDASNVVVHARSSSRGAGRALLCGGGPVQRSSRLGPPGHGPTRLAIACLNSLSLRRSCWVGYPPSWSPDVRHAHRPPTVADDCYFCPAKQSS
jgi:hypothetical protein